MSPDREVLVEYTITDAANQTSITKDAGAFPSRLSAFGFASKKPNPPSNARSLKVTVKFLDLSQVSHIWRYWNRYLMFIAIDRKQLLGHL